jgi:hypothetical protein
MEKIDPKVVEKTKDALMNDVAKGMSESRFWATFAQCLVCKAVTFRKNFALSHVCRRNDGRGHPYLTSDSPHASDLHRDVSPSGDLSEFPSSPTPTELADYDVFGGVDPFQTVSLEVDNSSAPDHIMVTDDNVAEDDHSDGVPSELTDDDFELPTLAEIMATVPRRVRFK